MPERHGESDTYRLHLPAESKVRHLTAPGSPQVPCRFGHRPGAGQRHEPAPACKVQPGRRQHVFDDFIAVGEHLISTGVTTRGQLALHGASNGER